MSQIFIPQWTSQAAKRGQSKERFMKNLNYYLKHEVDMEKHTACEREMQSRWVARHVGKQTVEGLGKAIAHIPARDFFRAVQVCGEEFWNDKGEVKAWLRDNESHRAQS